MLKTLEESEGEVAVEVALVEFVEDDGVDTLRGRGRRAGGG